MASTINQQFKITKFAKDLGMKSVPACFEDIYNDIKDSYESYADFILSNLVSIFFRVDRTSFTSLFTVLVLCEIFISIFLV